MYTRLRTVCGGALVLLALAACGASSTEGTPAVPTAVPLDAQTMVPESDAPGDQTAYPAPLEVAPPQSSAYPGAAPAAPTEVPSAYPGVTTTP